MMYHKVLYVYVYVLVLGSLFNVVLSDTFKTYLKENVFLFKSGNIINEVFAHNGNLVWSILFILLSLQHVYLNVYNFDPLDETASFSKKSYISLVRQYCWKFILKNVLIFIAFLIIDEIFLWTGGHCSTGGRSSLHCHRNNGIWDGGYDISGHFCFLTNISSILWLEYLSLQQKLKKHVDLMDAIVAKGHYKFMQLVQCLVVTTLTIWILLLMITATFYHTFSEKILGLIMGYICPIVMYFWIPQNESLNTFFYT